MCVLIVRRLGVHTASMLERKLYDNMAANSWGGPVPS
jgi:hypothetical protein